MVYHHRYLQFNRHVGPVNDDESQKLELDGSNSGNKRTRPKLFSFLFLAILSCSFVAAPLFSGSSFRLSVFLSPQSETGSTIVGVSNVNASPCSSLSTGTICCDRSGYRSDICIMKGDIRTRSSSSTIFLYHSNTSNDLINHASRPVRGSNDEDTHEFQHEKIKPYTRKWEKSIMDTIDELDLISKRANLGSNHNCDVQHDVPAVFFSNGGYTGNVYHEFNDGIIPLYITSQHFKKKVVFVIVEYHNWWIMKYGDILSHLSDFPAIDFGGDNRTHCFPEAVVGLKIHDELTVDSSLMEGNKSIVDFRNLLDRAYWPRIGGLVKDEERKLLEKSKQQIALSQLPKTPTSQQAKKEVQENRLKKPKLVVLSRIGSRAITNENLMVKMAEEIGFQVEILRPDRRTELAKIYWALNGSDVMIGVHGAAMTHFLFMRPGTVFIQIVPLGLTWAADTYYGQPARKLGLKYIGYKIHPRESSLYYKYDKKDLVLTDPESINNKGWEFTKRIYLDSQKVTLDLRRFHKRLCRAYKYTVSKSKLHFQHQAQ